jgi:hypothetical protein
MAAKQGPDVLFCMPDRVKRVLSVFSAAQHADPGGTVQWVDRQTL